MKQIIAVTGLTLGTLSQRAWMSLAAVVSVALAVGVLLGFLAMSAGFASTFASSGSDEVAVVLRSGAGGEFNSNVTRDQIRLLEEGPGVARGAAGRPLVSGEVYVIVDGTKRSSGTEANLPLRGVSELAADVRLNIDVVEGRIFTPGTNELVVGEAVLKEFAGFELGEEVRLGATSWTVVGVFAMGGSVFESEVWADGDVIRNLYQRGTGSQSARVRLTDANAFDAYAAYVADEPRLQLDVQRESDFFASQGDQLRYLALVGWALGVVMAIGAFAGAWNTMYFSVDSRTREIATLRTIGFSGFAAFVASMSEAMLLALLGGLVGSIGAYLLLDGITASTLGSGFTQVVFTLSLGPQLIANGVVLALIVGALGGFFPALRAARTPLAAVHTG